MSNPPRTIADLVFIGLQKRVIALDRYTGEEVWVWKAPKSGGFTALLIDGDRLIVSAGGYIHCLDPVHGQEVWSNPLTGYGVGVTSLASVHGSAGSAPQAAAIAEQHQHNQAVMSASAASSAAAASG